MYVEYCGIACAVIVLLSLAVYYYMKKRGQANKENINNLIGSTVLAMFCSVMSPFLAKQMVHKLYFSVWISVILSWAILAVLTGSLFLIFRDYAEGKSKNKAQAAGPYQPNAVQEDAHNEINDGSQAAAWIETIAASDADIKQDAQLNKEIGAGPDITASGEYENENNGGMTEPDINVVEAAEEDNIDDIPGPIGHEVAFEKAGSDIFTESEIEAYESLKKAENDIAAEFGAEIPEAFEEAAVGISDESGTDEAHTEEIHTQDIHSEEIHAEGIHAEEINSEETLDLTLEELINSALDLKDKREYQMAISMYERALDMNPDKQMMTLIIIDLCSLYKLTNRKDLALNMLENVGKKLLDADIKESIMQNL